VGLGSQEGTEAFDPVVGCGVCQVHPEDVVEDGVVRRADRVHVRRQQQLPATQAAWDVHVAGGIGVQPQREEGQPDVV
jgi:hypothetical protein